MSCVCTDQLYGFCRAIAKVLVGEIVEKGREAMFLWGEAGALSVQHVREATRLLKQEGVIPEPRPAQLLGGRGFRR